MADRNEKMLLELLKKPGNNECADCGSKSPKYASYNIGIFVCTTCAGVHRGMGAHISKVKHLKLDRFEDSQLERLKEIGNNSAKLKYEERVPPCYRRPNENDPHLDIPSDVEEAAANELCEVIPKKYDLAYQKFDNWCKQKVLIEQWIRAKYEREEFCHPERQTYTSGNMVGFLMKRGKEDSRYHPRKFVLSEAENTLKYYVKENKEPKAILRISELNVAFAPEKIQHKNSMQISFLKDGSTRHIYVYHEQPEVITNWYMAIRCAKLHRLQIAYPAASESELVDHLTRDFAKEGWLWKTGPRTSDAYKKRWFSLDNRKLMYHDDSLDAHPKGEIFLGHQLEGYSVRIGTSPGVKDLGFAFSLRTPERTFNLSAMTESDRDEWILVIEQVLDRPLTPQDNSIAARLIRKRTGTNTMNIFSTRYSNVDGEENTDETKTVNVGQEKKLKKHKTKQQETEDTETSSPKKKRQSVQFTAETIDNEHTPKKLPKGTEEVEIEWMTRMPSAEVMQESQRYNALIEEQRKEMLRARENKNVNKPKKHKNKSQEPLDEDTETSNPKQSVQFTPETIDNEQLETNDSPKKRPKKNNDLEIETRLPTEEELQEMQKPENIKDVGSKRQQKRQKHEKLLADNKVKQDAVFTERSLNYLSRWKHNRDEWKFEKLRQVWLQNHMFDSSVIPEKFFDILVEYFGGSKGKIREVLIDTCMKIVDEAEANEEAAEDVKFKRARTLLQFLQE